MDNVKSWVLPAVLVAQVFSAVLSLVLTLVVIQHRSILTEARAEMREQDERNAQQLNKMADQLIDAMKRIGQAAGKASR